MKTNRLTKAESIAYLKSLGEKERAIASEVTAETTNAVADAVLPVSRIEVREEMEILETFTTFRRDQRREQDVLTSDEA